MAPNVNASPQNMKRSAPSISGYVGRRRSKQLRRHERIGRSLDTAHPSPSQQTVYRTSTSHSDRTWSTTASRASKRPNLLTVSPSDRSVTDQRSVPSGPRRRVTTIRRSGSDRRSRAGVAWASTDTLPLSSVTSRSSRVTSGSREVSVDTVRNGSAGANVFRRSCRLVRVCPWFPSRRGAGGLPARPRAASRVVHKQSQSVRISNCLCVLLTEDATRPPRLAADRRRWTGPANRQC